MLIIPIKEGENIDRALKRFKRKFDRTGTMRQLRKRQQFTKPSVVRRQQIQKAEYKSGHNKRNCCSNGLTKKSKNNSTKNGEADERVSFFCYWYLWSEHENI